MPNLFGSGRFLFVVPPLAGHVNPTVAVGRELMRRGHQVAWAGPAEAVGPLLGRGATLFPAEDQALTDRLTAAREDWLTLCGPTAPRFLWEEFIVPLGHAMLPGVETAISRFRPDAIITDQQALAGGVAARRHDLPWATSATTPVPEATPHHPPMDLGFSDHLVLVFSTETLIGSTEEFPDHFAFVGPALNRPALNRPARGDFPWEQLADDRPKLLVRLETVADPAGARFLDAAAEAVADLDVQAIFVSAPLTRHPRNVLVRDRVPQLALLPHLSAVVSDGGHDTVCETLAHGLPLVVAPIRDDQSIIARQVAASGAGIAVRFAQVRAAELRDVITGVLTDAAYRTAARAVQSSFAAAGGTTAAADRLEKLL